MKKKIIILLLFSGFITSNSCDIEGISDISIGIKFENITLKVGEEIEIPFTIVNKQYDEVLQVKSQSPDIIEVISEHVALLKAIKTGVTKIKLTYKNKSKIININVVNEKNDK